MRLLVDKTWDGQPIAPRWVAELVLSTTPEFLIIEVGAPWHGDPPPSAPPGPTWALWEHEVVELFVLGPNESYLEVELGPHGHHLVLQLEGRREIVARELPIGYEVSRQGERWSGRAEVPLAYLPPGPHRGNAYAIHGVGPGRRFLAAHPVPGPAPDFHRLEYFECLDVRL